MKDVEERAKRTPYQRSASATPDVYAQVTEQVIAALEAGTVPWRQPWTASGEPLSLQTGKAYRGINVVLLGMHAMAAGYESPYWVTFRQAKARGGTVRKGERSQLVVFWKLLRKRDKQSGDEKVIPLLRTFRVFNAEQCDGLGELPALAKPLDFSPVEAARQVIADMPKAPEIRHGGGRAFYAPQEDFVALPTPESFESVEAYYRIAFHELTHATGHESRLGRTEIGGQVRWGSEGYSREELVAELGAAMLCASAGVAPDIEQSAAYCASWLSVLRDDPKMLVSAGSRAQRAADFILDRQVAA